MSIYMCVCRYRAFAARPAVRRHRIRRSCATCPSTRSNSSPTSSSASYTLPPSLQGGRCALGVGRVEVWGARVWGWLSYTLPIDRVCRLRTAPPFIPRYARHRGAGSLGPYPEYSRGNFYPWSPFPPRRVRAIRYLSIQDSVSCTSLPSPQGARLIFFFSAVLLSRLELSDTHSL